MDNLNHRKLKEILKISKQEEELIRRMQQDGCDRVQENGQLKFGGPAPCEHYLCLRLVYLDPKIVKSLLENDVSYDVSLNDLFRVFSPVGFVFVEFSTKAEATRAIEFMSDCVLRPRHCIGLVKSVDNCRLFVGNLPIDKSTDEIKSEMMRLTEGVKECHVYSSIADNMKDSGFAFVEYVNPRATSKAHRKLIPEGLHVWGNEITVNRAAPEPEIDDAIRTKVTVPYVRNLSLTTTEQTFSDLFNQTADVKMTHDFVLVHFISRDAGAEEIIKKLKSTRFNGNVEVTWSKQAREKNKVSFVYLSSAGSGRSSSIGSRPSSRKTLVILLPCVSPTSSVHKPPLSSQLRSEQMKQDRGPFSPEKQQQFHLPPLAMPQSINFMQLAVSNFLSLPPTPPMELRNREFGPLDLAVPTFLSVRQQTLGFNDNAMFCPLMGKLTLRPQCICKYGITAPASPMMNLTAAVKIEFTKIVPPLHTDPQT